MNNYNIHSQREKKDVELIRKISILQNTKSEHKKELLDVKNMLAEKQSSTCIYGNGKSIEKCQN